MVSDKGRFNENLLNSRLDQKFEHGSPALHPATLPTKPPKLTTRLVALLRAGDLGTNPGPSKNLLSLILARADLFIIILVLRGRERES